MGQRRITNSPLDELEDLIILLAEEVIKAKGRSYTPSARAGEAAKWLLGEQGRRPRASD